MTTSLPSIRVRLSRTLLAWSVLWSIAVSAAVWLTVQREINELLDDTLQAAATVLRGLLAQQLGAASLPVGGTGVRVESEATSAGGFAWQLVDYADDGQAHVLLASPLAPLRALRSTPSTGITDVPKWRIFGTPLPDGRHWLYVAQTHHERRETQIEVALSAALATLAMALLAHIWLRGQIRQELAPLQRLADRLADHDPVRSGTSLGRAERAELQPVHGAIDALAARLARRLAQERAFTSHAAHALRTPLAGMDAQLAVALRQSPAEIQPRLLRVRTAASRLQRVVVALLTLFRSGAEPKHEPLDIATLAARLPVEGLTIEVQGERTFPGDPDLLAAALLNLCDNSLRNGATHVTLSTPAAATLRIEDDGSGVTVEQRARLRTALARQEYEGNTGLGLLLADLVARAHGGELTLPDVDRGFAVEIRLVSGTS